jgi:uncharacterized membrane protein SpoIIM required for sporulation
VAATATWPTPVEALRTGTADSQRLLSKTKNAAGKLAQAPSNNNKNIIIIIIILIIIIIIIIIIVIIITGAGVGADRRQSELAL